MGPFIALWDVVRKNVKSVRLSLMLAALAFFVAVLAGEIHSPDAVWVVDGATLQPEHYMCDLVAAVFVCVCVQSACWMDTYRPFDRTKLAWISDLDAPENDPELPDEPDRIEI